MPTEQEKNLGLEIWTVIQNSRQWGMFLIIPLFKKTCFPAEACLWQVNWKQIWKSYHCTPVSLCKSILTAWKLRAHKPAVISGEMRWSLMQDQLDYYKQLPFNIRPFPKTLIVIWGLVWGYLGNTVWFVAQWKLGYVFGLLFGSNNPSTITSVLKKK